jgi:hypothetical protein
LLPSSAYTQFQQTTAHSGRFEGGIKKKKENKTKQNLLVAIKGKLQ